VLVAAALLAGAARAQAPAPAKYKGHGITFAYPGTWAKVAPGQVTQRAGTPVWEQWLQIPNTATDGQMSTDLVMLGAYRLSVSITAANIAAYDEAIRAALDSFLTQLGTTVTSPVTRTVFGKFPAYQLEIDGVAPDNSPVHSRLVYAFNGRTEYALNCQHGTTSAVAPDVMLGCDQIQQSFKLVPKPKPKPKPKKKRGR